ncbi:MAG: voltage-gated chloride channel [Epsilonproteobacteria bacterium]|nr:voltage-gated chloride channel [Campylobacterota bacterium]NPA63922.1 voltage-gated chloride channel [Campylobacterota bacterium]
MYKKMLRHIGQNLFDLYRASGDILKWSFLSLLVGAGVGFCVGTALNILETSINARDPILVGFLPFILALSGYLLHRFFKEASADGTEEIIRAAIYADKRLNLFRFLLKQSATFATLFFGGSAGKEAPSAQIGAYLSSLGAKIFNLSPKERIIIIVAGTSAGFAVVFGSPIAAGFFALEALFAGRILYQVLVPSFIASFVAYWIMHILHVEFIYHPVAVGLIPSFWEIVNISKTVVAGIFFGLIAYIVILAMNGANTMAMSQRIHPLLKGVLGGGIILLLAAFVGDRYLGLGLESIEAAFLDEVHFSWADPVLKTLFTFLTLGSGGSGGFVTPIFFIGATSGNFFAHLIDAKVSLFAALGFVSVLSGATNSPIASTILAAELFGIEVAHFAAVTATISYLVSSKKSVFAPQIIEVIEIKFKRHINS